MEAPLFGLRVFLVFSSETSSEVSAVEVVSFGEVSAFSTFSSSTVLDSTTSDEIIGLISSLGFKTVSAVSTVLASSILIS